jgi:hypothetical protein
MSRILLETADGEFVHVFEYDWKKQVDVVCWNTRFFGHPKQRGASVVFRELVVLNIPYEMPKARPADDVTEPDPPKVA